MRRLIYVILSVFFIFNFWTSFSETPNEEVSNKYIYYYGQWCTHCASLDSYLEKTNWYDKLWIEKKEVYFDNDNRNEMLEAWKRLWISDSSIWVPFFVVVEPNWKEIPLIWDWEIISYIKPYLWEIPSSEGNKKTIVLIILWALAILIPIWIITLSNKNK